MSRLLPPIESPVLAEFMLALDESTPRATWLPGSGGLDVTTAELSAGEKDRISHRGRAFRLLAPMLLEALG